MGVVRGGRGPSPPWILKVVAKKFVFLVLNGKKQISPLLPPGQILEKSPSAPTERILPTPMSLKADTVKAMKREYDPGVRALFS